MRVPKSYETMCMLHVKHMANFRIAVFFFFFWFSTSLLMYAVV